MLCLVGGVVDGGVPEGANRHGDQLSHQVKKDLKTKVTDLNPFNWSSN